MSTHSFHPTTKIKARWLEGASYACASIEFDDCRIDLFATGEDMQARMERAINAFSRELEREPVAQAAE
jgi:hypothetical protein